MKSYNNLFAQIISFDNLLTAAYHSRKGRRYNLDIVQFHFRLEDELFRLSKQLATKTYQPGPYQTFYIHDPKERMISAAPYRDRVVHHALCNVIAPLFEKTFIYDSYANRIGKGSHQAIRRYQHYAQKHAYVLKCDIRKFFPSVDHAILKEEIRRKIWCKDTLWLIDSIIDNSNPQEPHIVYFPQDDLFSPHERRRGLPIGNLTSQFWANVYLNRFDHFVKEELRVPGYIRYVDDFVIFSSNKLQLHQWQRSITSFLVGFRLLPHPNKTHIHVVKNGVPFLGFKVYPYRRKVHKSSTNRYLRFLKKKLFLKEQGKLSPEKLETGLNSWLGHIRFAQSERLEYKTYWYLYNQGVGLFKHPRGSWRVLEQ